MISCSIVRSWYLIVLLYCTLSKSMADTNGKKEDCIVLPDDCSGYPVSYFNIPRHSIDDLECVLIPRGLVVDRTEKLAAEIFSKLDLSKPLVALCVLKGGYNFFNDLLQQLRQLSSQSEKSCRMSIDFIRLKSYENDQSSGLVKVIGGDDLSNVTGKNVLIVEDIVDTGRTMQKLLQLIEPYKANKVMVASMLVKRTTRSCGYRPDYIGFEVPDKFLVGYGLDFNEYFRDMGHICVLKSSAMDKYMD